jgi:hypothetical protein
LNLKPLAACLVPLLAAAPALACNPAPPRPPILEGHAYDAKAAEYLVRDAASVVAARLALRIDIDLGEPAAGRQADYVFEVLEGWGAETARRVTIGGRWVSCELPLHPGRVFLLYLDGERLLHAVPAEQLDFEFALLGEPAWFYDAGGRLVHGAGDAED